MTPTLSSHDATDLLLTDPELDGEISLADVTSGVSLTYFGDVALVQDGHSVAFTAVVGKLCSSFPVSVSVVVANRSQEPMGVVVTGTDITGVQHAESVRDGADTQHVTDASCYNHVRSSVGSIRSVPQEAVLASAKATCPGPALIRTADVDLRPVALSESSWHGVESTPRRKKEMRRG